MHPKVHQALEEIDAQLYSGENSSADLKTLETYIESWVRQIASIRECNEEFVHD
jgi:hypothetical protein